MYTGNTLTLFKLLKKTNCSITEEVRFVFLVENMNEVLIFLNKIIQYMSVILQAMRTEMNKKQFQV